MQKQLTRFSKYYQVKHSGRKLDWNHGLGTAILKARFATSVKELSVSLFQAVVLLLFNESYEVSFQDIKAHVQMSECYIFPPQACLIEFKMMPSCGGHYRVSPVARRRC